MNKTLVIVFVKNIQLGKVKTRLAKTIGNKAAFQVYTELVKLTENTTKNLQNDVHIYFSETVTDNLWKNHYKTTQEGNHLGERMKNAFKKSFKAGYKRVVLIGTDLPDINKTHITKGLDLLKQNDVVFGPAEDGGYYLIGLSKMHDFIFDNKPWSQPNLLAETRHELNLKNIKFSTLVTLNDIDVYNDLITSNFYKSNIKLQEKIKQLND